MYPGWTRLRSPPTTVQQVVLVIRFSFRNKPTIQGHEIFVVDLQDGGNWDWSTGEPPKDNPAYYLRFCKSFARMGGDMHYVQSDNLAFTHNLLKELDRDS